MRSLHAALAALLLCSLAAAQGAENDKIWSDFMDWAKTQSGGLVIANYRARLIANGLPAASYLASQAARGATIYAATCENCHAEGQLVGAGFVASWNNRRVYDLYALVRSTMPLDNPGGLKDGDYLDVVAYLLQANKHQSGGADSLRSDTLSLRGTRIAIGAP